MHKTTGEVSHQERLVIHVLKALIWMHKTTREGWNPYSLVLSTLLCVQTCKSGPKVAVLQGKKTQMRAGTHTDLAFWCKSSSFACLKRQVKSGTHRGLLFRSKSRCFASKNHTWGLGPIETSNSDARHPVLHAENHRWGLGPLETCNFGPKIAGLNAQNHRWGLEPI